MTQDQLLEVVNHCPVGMLQQFLHSVPHGLARQVEVGSASAVFVCFSYLEGVMAGTDFSRWYQSDRLSFSLGFVNPVVF